MTTCPPVQPCFCPSADLPVSPVNIPQGGPAETIVVTLYGSPSFSVNIVTNPILPITLLPIIASVQVLDGNQLTITTTVPALTETIAAYAAQLNVCNTCGQLLIDLSLAIVA